MSPVLLAALMLATLPACGDDGSEQVDDVEQTLAACQDGDDNDSDGFIDCDDQDCGIFAVCAASPGDTAAADGLESPDGEALDTSPDEGPASDLPTTSDGDTLGGPCTTHDQCNPASGWVCIEGTCTELDDFSPGPEDDDAPDMGVLDGFGARTDTQPIGAVIDSFCGIPAYSNGPNIEHVEHNGPFGYEYQCTELAYRFLCEHYALCEKKVQPYGNAKQWYGNTWDPALGQLDRYPNGGSEPPRPGDVVVWGNGKYGHVAIVKEVILEGDPGVVKVLEQNFPGSPHSYDLGYGDGTYQMTNVLGWMRVPDSAPACGASGGFDSVVPQGDDLLVEASASSVLGLESVALRIDGGPEAYADATAGETAVSFQTTVDLADLDLAPGHHEIQLVVTPVGETTFELDSAGFVYTPTGPHPYIAMFHAAATEFGVPACLLMAIGSVESNWFQGAVSPDGGYGVMQLTGSTLEAAAGLVGVSASLMKDNSLAGAEANIRGAAALMAAWADDAPGGIPLMYDDDPIKALESWWFVVVRYNGAGVDGSLLTSNYVYRVYNRLAFGVEGLFPGAGIDLYSFPPDQGHRPATPQEISLGETNSTDPALIPPIPANHIRTFEDFHVLDLAAQHDCQGACATPTCETPECTPNAAKKCVGGTVRWVDSCGNPGALVNDCDDDNPCTSDTCGGSSCNHSSLSDGTPCGGGKVCDNGTCGCSPQDHQACSEGSLLWFDSCGNPGALVDDCDDENPCTDDSCSGSSCTHPNLADGTPCGGGKVCDSGGCGCSLQDHQACSGGALRWFDSCGNPGALVNDCDDENPCTDDSCSGSSCTHSKLADGTPCGGGKVCDNGGCGCSPQDHQECSGGALRWFDSCGNPGAVVDDCDDQNPCTSDTCQGFSCNHEALSDGTPCGQGMECQSGVCGDACVDGDGDGYFQNCEPYDCEGHDDDEYIHPDATDVWDIRDNDCDGIQDENGHVRYDRYHKPWTSADWEHRFATSAPSGSGWESDGHWIELYPTNVCGGAYQPEDDCSVQDGGRTIQLWGSFILVALSQCTGTLGEHHVSLLLAENSGEFADYQSEPGFQCTRLGYALNGAAFASMPGAVRLYRHESGFSAQGKGDHMWSADPLEGDPLYDVHGPSHGVLDAK